MTSTWNKLVTSAVAIALIGVSIYLHLMTLHAEAVGLKVVMLGSAAAYGVFTLGRLVFRHRAAVLARAAVPPAGTAPADTTPAARGPT